ncbi:caspase family protein [Rhizobium sp. RU20A]|uniref:caspase family protein n=1 Tax=Rhizobium sp. RU20A TaxID=1907412 RepID=UPI00165F4317|nr:caspase family protein [Rhizobium sp. RU20A]
MALVVGNAEYQHAGRLKNPSNDADDMSEALKKYGFEVVVAKDSDSRQFERDIETFAQAMHDADVALFYYSGHALQLGSANYLLPVDFNADTELAAKRQAFALADIIEQMERAAKVSLIFLDACRNNPLAETLGAKLESSGRSAILGRGLAPVSAGSANTMIVFATAPGSVAADGQGRNSPFTQSMLLNMASPGVEIETMMKRVTNEVATGSARQQMPERLSKLTVEFYFQPRQPASAQTAVEAGENQSDARPDAGIAAEAAFWQAIQSSTRPDDFEDYLAGVKAGRFTGLFTSLAERRLVELRGATAQEAAVRTDETPREAPDATGTIAVAKLKSITTRGMNGNVLVEGTIRKTGNTQWVETNTQNPAGLTFEQVEINDSSLVLFDTSRSLYLKIDLAEKLTYWRQDQSAAWNLLYTVVESR